MTDDPFRAIETGIVPALTDVRFYDSTLTHVNEEHPEVQVELPSIQTGVDNAVQNPTSVEQLRPRTYVFVSAENTNAKGDPLRVAVKHVEGTSGRVSTVFFATARTDENVIWRRGSNG